MSHPLWEKATINFYNWDYLGRGYYLYDEQVSIEPPYKTFKHKGYSENKYIDDGRVPNLFEQFLGLFEKKETYVEPEDHDPKIEPDPPVRIAIDAGFSVSFPKGTDISPSISKEFLEMLSFSEAPISYEILGTSDEIIVQIISSKEDKQRIESHFRAYFPLAIIRDVTPMILPFNINNEVAICDFGFDEEFSRPISTSRKFDIDPLTSIIATLDNLTYGEVAMMQIIFQGVASPWARDIPFAVTDGAGESFFADSPEMIDCAKDKISSPLFSCVMRMATQGKNAQASGYLVDQLTSTIETVSSSTFNKLIPLSNEGYDYQDHLYNLYHRTSNRLGMIVNSNEIVTFAHYPNKTVISAKLGLSEGTTKLVPLDFTTGRYFLGVNEHQGAEVNVILNDEVRLKHTHIIGATGVGKSTLIANMILGDIQSGNGCALFDPHGDIAEDVLSRIPESRKGDVIVIDPSDLDYPIGFNLLEAKTEIEKIVLSSDLVSAFQRHATAWGDNMTAVLSNAINAFLESDKGGTLIELKRFLVEDRFRDDFLKTIKDPSIYYYWTYDYPMMKKGIGPLLTRIDTFMRPKVIRFMLAQKSGINFKTCIEEKKVILIKLSQGLIGNENSYLLGSLFLSKLNQAALNRQALARERRHPFYLYLDEFEAFLTPSITSILSGARKYGLGLILAHQELAQLDDPKILNSVISNPNIRICFRLGDNDAKKLSSGFSSFEHDDLQKLGVGNAIMRIGGSNNDFNLRTLSMSKIDESKSEDAKAYIINNTRKQFSTPRAEVQSILEDLLPNASANFHEEKIESDSKKESYHTASVTDKFLPVEEEKEKFLNQKKETEVVRKHKELQNFVRALAIQRDFKTTIEEVIENGGRVDIGLQRDDLRIAIEISVTNTLDYEVQNIQKCINAGYSHIVMLSESLVHIKNIQKRANKVISKEDRKKVHYTLPLRLTEILDGVTDREPTQTKKVRGYRIKSNQVDIDSTSAQEKNQSLRNIIRSQLKGRNPKKL